MTTSSILCPGLQSRCFLADVLFCFCFFIGLGASFFNSNPPPTLPPLCCHRRGNWITLKLKKLIKSGSREHGVDQLHVHEPFGQDGGSFLSSDGLGGSAGHALSPPQRHSSECQPLSVESQRSSSPAFHSSNHIPGSEVTVGHDSNFPCCAESTATCLLQVHKLPRNVKKNPFVMSQRALTAARLQRPILKAHFIRHAVAV